MSNRRLTNYDEIIQALVFDLNKFRSEHILEGRKTTEKDFRLLIQAYKELFTMHKDKQRITKTDLDIKELQELVDSLITEAKQDKLRLVK